MLERFGGGITRVDRNEEVSSAVIPTMQGIYFRDLAYYDRSCCYCYFCCCSDGMFSRMLPILAVRLYLERADVKSHEA
jgi:hypothetical protein